MVRKAIGPKSNALINVFVVMILKDFCRDALRSRSSDVGFYIAGVFVWVLLAGCQTLGTTALGVGRGAYNDVIARTGSEQTLGFIVRLRYADPIGLLTVSSVTAGLKFSAQTKVEAGFDHLSSTACCSMNTFMVIMARFLVREEHKL